MNTIILKEFGSTLGSRNLGKEVNKKVDFSGSEKIIIDFKDIKMVTSSFADELIGKNSKKLGLQTFFKKVEIKNASEQIKIILKKSILDRLSEF
jgi:hypothetical protein